MKDFLIANLENKNSKHQKCKLTYDEHNGDYDCDYGSVLTCEECKYGLGRKDPEAKVNKL